MSDNPYSNQSAEPSDLASEGNHDVLATPQGAPARTGGGYKSQMNRGNIIMAALFVAAGGLVYALTLRKGPAVASAEVQNIRSQVNTALQRFQASGSFTSAAKVSTQDLLARFSNQIVHRQIPLESLQKDPFVFVPPPRVVKPTGQTPEAVSPVDAQQQDPMAQSRREVQARFEALSLQAVQTGASGMMAIISNNLVTPGQKIECFTVKRIEEDSVVLTWEDEEFILKMQ